MTKEQQATLGQIAVWVGTAQELLQQANVAVYGDALDGAVPFTVLAAIGNAAIRATDAVNELTPLVAAMVVEHE